MSENGYQGDFESFTEVYEAYQKYQNKIEEDNFINYIFRKEPTFLEKCLTCKLYFGCDKDVGDQLCGADKKSIVTCLSVDIEMQLAKLSGCVMFKEIR